MREEIEERLLQQLKDRFEPKILYSIEVEAGFGMNTLVYDTFEELLRSNFGLIKYDRFRAFCIVRLDDMETRYKIHITEKDLEELE